MREYSTCWPPALQTDSSTLVRCLPLAQCFRIAVVDLSIRALTCRSLKLTLPAPPPPPTLILPGWEAPQEKEVISVQPVWLESLDSPVTPSTFRNISIAIISTLRG